MAACVDEGVEARHYLSLFPCAHSNRDECDTLDINSWCYDARYFPKFANSPRVLIILDDGYLKDVRLFESNREVSG